MPDAEHATKYCRIIPWRPLAVHRARSSTKQSFDLIRLVWIELNAQNMRIAFSLRAECGCVAKGSLRSPGTDSDMRAWTRVGVEIDPPGRRRPVHPDARGLRGSPDGTRECRRERRDADNIDCRATPRRAADPIRTRLSIQDERPRRHLGRCRRLCGDRLQDERRPCWRIQLRNRLRQRPIEAIDRAGRVRATRAVSLCGPQPPRYLWRHQWPAGRAMPQPRPPDFSRTRCTA
jgi:hypothetical protein